jgi:NAD(P)-dependent dehydrogenase (short-subunit alcohol dehydrogenase family)
MTLHHLIYQSCAPSFGRSLAADLAPRIRVNTVSPGPIETPIFGKLGLPSEVVQVFAADMLQRNPLKRIGQVHDVARLHCSFFRISLPIQREPGGFENIGRGLG